jgi:hypothetical protein
MKSRSLLAPASAVVLLACTIGLNDFASAQSLAKTPPDATNNVTTKNAAQKSGSVQSAIAKPASKTRTPRMNAAQLTAARKSAAKSAFTASAPGVARAPFADTYTPTNAPMTANASVRTKASAIQIPSASSRGASASTAFAQNQTAHSVIVAPTSIDAHVLRNMYEPLTTPSIEVGDRPARGTSLCSDGRARRFGEIDMKAFAQTLPDFNVARPRTVCVRRGVLMADYVFK